MHISDYWEKVPFLMLHLHTLIYNSFYSLCRNMVKWKFTFNFEFFLYCFYTWVKGKFLNNGVNCVIPWWHWSILEPTKEIRRVCNWSAMLIENRSDILLFDNILCFWSNIIFSCTLLFLFQKYDIYMLSKMVSNYNQH